MLAREDRIAVPDCYHLDLAHRWVVQLYRAWGKPEKAAEWRVRMAQTFSEAPESALNGDGKGLRHRGRSLFRIRP
jgi:hypothetical protein